MPLPSPVPFRCPGSTARRLGLALAAATMTAGMAAAQAPPAATPAQPAEAPRPWQPWFEPAQLPRFTGTVERYLPAPDGSIDGLLFREGAQVIVPPDLAPRLREAAPEGRLLVVFGLRARAAPAITMLAWATSEAEEPQWVERPAWPRAATWQPGQRLLRAEGVVRTTLFAANGEPNGALLEDGTVVRLAPRDAQHAAERLKRGARLAAEGPGIEQPLGRALLARAIGETHEAMAPLPGQQ